MTTRLLAIALLGLVVTSIGCATFHAGTLPGAPADAAFVDVDGVHVRYRESGTGPAVVLIHGYGASADSWSPVIPAIAVHHRVIAVDLKGFGWTSRPDGDYSPAAQAALVWHVLDKLGVTDVAIVGHSWGSSVALSMAVAQPTRVRRVALYSAYVYDDQVPSFFRWAEKPGIGEALFTLFYRQRIEDRVPLAYYDERWVTQERVERVEAELDREGTVAAALAVARKHQFADLHVKLKGFPRPVLLLWGENDEVTPIQFGERLAAELPNARLVRFPRCGHIPMVEAHNQSTRELAIFLATDSSELAPAPPAPTEKPSVPSGSIKETPVSLSEPRKLDTEKGRKESRDRLGRVSIARRDHGTSSSLEHPADSASGSQKFNREKGTEGRRDVGGRVSIARRDHGTSSFLEHQANSASGSQKFNREKGTEGRRDVGGRVSIARRDHGTSSSLEHPANSASGSQKFNREKGSEGRRDVGGRVSIARRDHGTSSSLEHQANSASGSQKFNREKGSEGRRDVGGRVSIARRDHDTSSSLEHPANSASGSQKFNREKGSEGRRDFGGRVSIARRDHDTSSFLDKCVSIVQRDREHALTGSNPSRSDNQTSPSIPPLLRLEVLNAAHAHVDTIDADHCPTRSNPSRSDKMISAPLPPLLPVKFPGKPASSVARRQADPTRSNPSRSDNKISSLLPPLLRVESLREADASVANTEVERHDSPTRSNPSRSDKVISSLLPPLLRVESLREADASVANTEVERHDSPTRSNPSRSDKMISAPLPPLLPVKFPGKPASSVARRQADPTRSNPSRSDRVISSLLPPLLRVESLREADASVANTEVERHDSPTRSNPSRSDKMVSAPLPPLLPVKFPGKPASNVARRQADPTRSNPSRSDNKISSLLPPLLRVESLREADASVANTEVERHDSPTRSNPSRSDKISSLLPPLLRVESLEEEGGGGDGGAGGGTGGGPPELDPAVEAAIIASEPKKPDAQELDLPIGADLAALGAELTPRRYAAPREKGGVNVHGSFRLREQGLFNLDLDRGLDSRGQPVFPVPLGGGQQLEAADLRARTDVAFYAPGVGVAVKARIDWLDNVALGGQPDLANGSPATSPGQRPTVVVVKRAWGEVLTPFGVLAAGRMGAHFGLGISANGGDCDDCDKGDAADRIAFVAPIAGHFLAVAWDVAARGPFTQSRDGGHPIALETTDSASGLTFALLKMHSPGALARRAEAGRTSVEYGAYVAVRAQDRDVPASYLPSATPVTSFTSNDLVARGFSALTAGGWLRITRSGLRLEAEVVHARADIEQPSLIPGTEITIPVTSRQLGAAGELEVTNGWGTLGLKAGYASGDDAPGFGAYPKIGEAAPQAGAFDGPQANLPSDSTVDNFRFHPDYRIDQILFREIIGTITDAIYVRPSASATLMKVGKGRLEASAALIASWAVEKTSTPSGESGLGFEIDPELRYATREGFAAAITPAVFLPGAAFDTTMLEAKPAYAVRARLWFVF